MQKNALERRGDKNLKSAEAMRTREEIFSQMPKLLFSLVD
jgi:hypothetical protein